MKRLFAITIPLREPMTFARLRELNPEATGEQLVEAFPYLPVELREQAWMQAQLRTALEDWDADADPVA